MTHMVLDGAGRFCDIQLLLCDLDIRNVSNINHLLSITY